MKTALIGHTGFVGSNLTKQYKFTDLYNSKNIKTIERKKYDLIVSAGATADRNVANKNPKADWKGIKKLLNSLSTVKAKQFVLISTIDVYPNKVGANEDTQIKLKDLTQDYGKNRYKMERFVKKNFSNNIIVRCPNLYGINLKKNFLYDLIHNTGLEQRHSDSLLQFYNLDNLWKDIQKIINNKIKLINLSVEPLTCEEIAYHTLRIKFQNLTKEPPMFLDFKSKYDYLWGEKDGYLYHKKKTLKELKQFIKTEKKSALKPKLAISNLAWERKEDEKILSILKRYNIKAIEIAPSNIWPQPPETPEHQIEKYRSFWNKNGVEIIATTHLLSPYPELIIFGNNKARENSLNYLKKMVRISSILGAKAMNFGSPKNRKKGSLSKKKALVIARDFFWKVAEECKKYNINFAFEPNPTIYGGDFILTTKEAISLVKTVNHPNFGINIDLSTMTQNKEDYEKTLKYALSFAKHFHISEPHLKQIPQKISNHRKLAKVLKKIGYKGNLSIEMHLDKKTNHSKIITNTLKFITSLYN